MIVENKEDEKEDEIEFYEKIYKHTEIPMLDRIKVFLTTYCWIPFEEDAPLKRDVLIRYKTAPFSSRIGIEQLSSIYESDGNKYQVTHWLELGDSLESAYAKKFGNFSNDLTHTFFKSLKLKLKNKIKGYLVRFCWVSIKEEHKMPIGRVVLMRLKNKDETEEFAIGDLCEVFDNKQVTHWLEVLTSVDLLNLKF